MSEKMCGDRDRREELTPEKAGAGYGRRLWEELKGLLESAGAALAGCGDLRGQAYSVGIAVALPVPDPIIRQLLEGPTKEYYETYHAMNRKLNEIVLAGEAFLREKGFQAWAQTTDRVSQDEEWRTPLPHKTVATRAGLGWIGKSCILVTEQYGSAIRLSSLLTDAPLPCARPVTVSRCGACRACVDSCPAQALKGTLWRAGMERKELFDKEACYRKQVEIMRRRTGIEADLCGKCFAVCPYTRRYLARKQADNSIE